MPASGNLRMRRIREQNQQLHGKLDAYKEAEKNAGILQNLVWSLRKKDDVRRVSEREASAEIANMQKRIEHAWDIKDGYLSEKSPDLSERVIQAVANEEPPEVISEILGGLSAEQLSELIHTNETHHTMEFLLEEHAGELPFEGLSRKDRAELLILSDQFREQYKEDPSIRPIYAEWEKSHTKPQERFSWEEPERGFGMAREPDRER